jgi:RNA polymerase-binding protein DksA
MTTVSTAPTTPLSTEQRTWLAAQLRAQLQALDRQVHEHQAGQTRVEYAAELLSQEEGARPQHDADREVALERADREQMTLGAISQALARIDDPAFGLCEDCGEPIAWGRLQLEPWALRCVACESAREGRAVHHKL